MKRILRAAAAALVLAFLFSCQAAIPHLPGLPVTSPTEPAPPPSPTPALMEPAPVATEMVQAPAPLPAFTPVEPLPTHEPRVLNVLLLGSDAREGQTGPWRTDVIMWMTIHRDEKEIGILSLPRDLWVNIPWVGQNRINVADWYGEALEYPGGGPALVAETLKTNFGLQTDRYIRLNFEAFERVIDAMGGITVWVDCPLEDNFIDDTMPGGLRPLKVSAGEQVMDGKTALMYARSRHSTGDIDRTRRQQRVLLGIRDRALDVNMIPRIPRIWISLKNSVDTDLSLQEILSLALLAKDISSERIHGRVIDFTMVSNYTTSQGAMVLLPDYGRIQEAIATLMDSASLVQTSQVEGACP